MVATVVTKRKYSQLLEFRVRHRLGYLLSVQIEREAILRQSEGSSNNGKLWIVEIATNAYASTRILGARIARESGM